MSDMKATDANEQVCADKSVSEKDDVDISADTEHVDPNEGNSMPTPQEEEETIKKKYGGIIPKKPPLISKDHERAFFDSADWALGKPTPHQQVRSRRSAYGSADSEDGGAAATENVTDDQ